MEIRRLGSDEVDRFRAIRVRALGEAANAFGTTLADALAWSPQQWSELFSGLLAFIAVLGHSDVGIVRAAPDLHVEGAARLGSLWVAPEARGMGVGSRLVHAVLEWARSEGFEQVLLEVSDDNEPAIAIYERIGFAPTGEIASFPPPRTHLRRHQRGLTL